MENICDLFVCLHGKDLFFASYSDLIGSGISCLYVKSLTNYSISQKLSTYFRLFYPCVKYLPSKLSFISEINFYQVTTMLKKLRKFISIFYLAQINTYTINMIKR